MATIAVHADDARDIERLLAERIYEYNAAATGYRGAKFFAAVHEDGSAALAAGISGYTWGGCCFVSYLWVSAFSRGKGLGSELLQAVERHAREEGCRLVLLSTHSFQAPEFYARQGYEPVARVNDHPVGHASIFYAKRLDARDAQRS